jgi:hypothetical protein
VSWVLQIIKCQGQSIIEFTLFGFGIVYMAGNVYALLTARPRHNNFPITTSNKVNQNYFPAGRQASVEILFCGWYFDNAICSVAQLTIVNIGSCQTVVVIVS